MRNGPRDWAARAALAGLGVWPEVDRRSAPWRSKAPRGLQAREKGGVRRAKIGVAISSFLPVPSKRCATRSPLVQKLEIEVAAMLVAAMLVAAKTGRHEGDESCGGTLYREMRFQPIAILVKRSSRFRVLI